MILVKLISLGKRFKEVQAVDDLSFEVKGGEIFGLLGENGAGKTTTLRMLATMLKPTSGTASICDLDIVKQPSEVRKHIGILFGGEAGLYDRLTARENIAYFGKLNGMDDNALKKRIDELSQTLDMEEFIDRRVGKFSKGMKQKVTIARAIVHDPEVMLLDEPTVGLDVTAARTLQDFIAQCRDQGKAVIFSSHIMSEVERLCDRIGIIHKGRLVDIGTIDGLKQQYNNSNLEEVFIQLIGGKSA
ncbi:ATP-binding cassette domain-containing protein [Mahella australiensis]|uniref:ABC transporter ATP-binding protein n=1 Tax=Mahella australiensis TaxID=252966 RepID=UPI0002E47100